MCVVPLYFFQIASPEAASITATAEDLQVKPDDHSASVPPLPIPNRTVKRRCADDSASTRVKVGHRQAKLQAANREALRKKGLFAFHERKDAEKSSVNY